MLNYQSELARLRKHKGAAAPVATLDSVKPQPEPAPAPIPEPIPEPVPEPGPVPEPVPEPILEPVLDSAGNPVVPEGIAVDPVVVPAQEPVPEPVAEPAPAPEPSGEPVFDAVGTALFVDDVVSTDLDITAAAIVQEWAETLPEDLDAGEGPADRLLALMIGALPEDEFPDAISDDAADDLMDLGDAVGDVLADLGAADEDLDILLNDFDNDVGERVQELAAASLAEGIDPVGFVLGDGSDEPAFDAVYKRRIAVRGGKKMRINKRVSGRVVLSGAQKASVRKMQLKARTSMAKLRRAKSMRVRRRLGL